MGGQAAGGGGRDSCELCHRYLGKGLAGTRRASVSVGEITYFLIMP